MKNLPRYIEESLYLRRCPFTAMSLYLDEPIDYMVRVRHRIQLNYIAHNKSPELMQLLEELHAKKYGYSYSEIRDSPHS